ncbi:hypothetical protein PTTG_01446 [Puccinia triticina 1-1 BBBD Race 1]|uniref:Uncharacterized protein n=2 Tax=Puccinia triticina TaxID=208348 RepID=A0A0C4EL13_PUCT1|nr:uncharacterized protein PtA15_9A308 [Puccinia triticina]OAV99938.1 hypothetical protein PTTG_01446 [Puccinia triticina 1-1 BBBD Race 1]WAQ88183.1 hypothetical protein PtA15_9A308 [Puccinia triticina]WAR60371.1 hypothetical protein PtB15_9B310 [Puccinia triticina]
MRFVLLLAMSVLLFSRANGHEKRPRAKPIALSGREAMHVKIQKRSSSSFVRKLTKGLKAGSTGKFPPQKVAFKGPSKDFDSSSTSRPAKSQTGPGELPDAQISKSRTDTAKAPASKTIGHSLSNNNETPENRPMPPYRSSEAKDKAKTAEKYEDEKEKSSTVSTLFTGAKKAFDILKPEIPNLKEKDPVGETSEASTLLSVKNGEAGLVGNQDREAENKISKTSD